MVKQVPETPTSKKFISSVRWLGGVKFAGQAVSWIITLLVLRFLQPADYGLMASATVIIGFIALLSEVGFGPALIQAKEVDSAVISHVFGSLILIGVFSFAVLYSISPLVATFYKTPELETIIHVLSLQFLFLPFYTIPRALLERDMEFRSRSIVELVSNIIGGCLSLTLAYSGFGVWSLIFGSIAIILSKSVGFFIAKPWLFMPRLNIMKIREFWKFGGLVTLNSAFWYFYTRADILIIGRVLGQETLGVYSLAVYVASMPVNKISPILNQLLLPFFSRLQEKLSEMAWYLVKISGVVSFVAVPLFVGLFAVADDFVRLCFGDTWLSAVLPIKILCLVMPLRILGNMLTPAATGLGRVDMALKSMIAAYVLMPLAYWIGCKYGIIGVCYAWLIVFPLTQIIRFNLISKIFQVTATQYLREQAKPFIGSLIMYISIWTFKYYLPLSTTVMLSLSSSILLGVGVYTLWAFWVDRKHISEITLLVWRG